MKKESLRVALFSCVYHEVDGVARTSRHFEAFAQRRGLPFFMVNAGPQDTLTTSGSVTRLELKRSPVKFPLDRAHEYDLLFCRHYRKLASLIQNFRPDIVHITGPSDVGTLGAVIAHNLGIPLAASWQTNLHQFARRRAAKAASFLPQAAAVKLLDALEHSVFRATARFYKIPKVLFAPNQELIQAVETATGKPCFLMSHAVDTTVFRPELRNRTDGTFQIGYVGRLTPEKSVRSLARLEQALLANGHRDFRIIIVGEGGEESWLSEHMRHAEFRGVLTGPELSQAFANFDVLAFPSETDTFGLVVLEAFASGVPAVVTRGGGPKFTVQHGQTGFVAANFDEFAAFTGMLIAQPDLLAEMRGAARRQALTTSWEHIFESMYDVYGSVLLPATVANHSVFDVATT